jgi:hypothetical protein
MRHNYLLKELQPTTMQNTILPTSPYWRKSPPLPLPRPNLEKNIIPKMEIPKWT